MGSFIGGGNRSTQRKPPSCRKALMHYHTMLYLVHLVMRGIQTHNVSGNRKGLFIKRCLLILIIFKKYLSWYDCQKGIHNQRSQSFKMYFTLILVIFYRNCLVTKYTIGFNRFVCALYFINNIVLLISYLSFNSTHHFFRNVCTKSGSLQFSQFSGCSLICLFIYLWVLTFPLGDCSEFGNFCITLIKN